MKITKELNKEFPIYCYSIDILDIWSILIVNNPTLMSIH